MYSSRLSLALNHIHLQYHFLALPLFSSRLPIDYCQLMLSVLFLSKEALIFVVEIVGGPYRCESRLPEKARDTYSVRVADSKNCKVF